MDAQLPPSVPSPPVAFGGNRKASGKAKQPKTPSFSFEVCTPQSYKQQLALKETRYRDQITQDEASSLSENGLKRNLDLTNDQPSEGLNKRVKTINGTSDIGEPDTASGEKELVTFKLARRNVGGRPRIHPLKELPNKALLFLRKNYPVNQELCADVWTKIFDFSPPEFLLQARQTNSLFRMLLCKQSQWKKARLYTYGLDHPDPPPGLTEMQYADLLTGVGCQTKGCGERQTRKVYWAFQRRWCLKCLKTNTTRETDVAEVLEAYSSFRDCIPKVTFDSWNRYSWVGEPSQKPDWAQNAGTHIRYSCFALMLFIRDVDEFIAVGSDGKVKTKEEKEAWVDNRVKENRVLVEKLQQIEAYVEIEKRKKKTQAGVTKDARKDFFKEKALKLDPPLSGEALEMLPKYKASIEIPKPPTERSWQELLPKIQEARVKAEKRIRIKEKTAENSDAQKIKYTKLTKDREKNTTAEQRFVLDLAEKIISKVDGSVEAGSVAHVDFVPLVFRMIFEEYDGIHDTGKPGNYEGRPYRLVLDDARMIYEYLIAPAIDRWNDHAKIKAAKSLKCPGCKRKDSHRLHEFEGLIMHISDRHTEEVGNLSYFLPQHSITSDTSGIPWCTLKWPRNLPILASHREVVREWDPDDNSDYIHAPGVIPRNLSRDAFEGRCVVDGEDPPRGDFIKNVIHAASLLNGTPLATKFQTQIVFKYALDRHNNSMIPVQVLKDLPTALIRAGIRGLFEGFHCQACRANDAREKRHNKFADKKQSLGELMKHFLATHEHSSWSSSMFDLPSADELWEALMNPEAEQAFQTFENLFPETQQALDPGSESSKAASLGPSLDQTTRAAMSLHTHEQAVVPLWRDAI